MKGLVLVGFCLSLGFLPAPAATPGDTLVIADKLDLTVTLDPAEVFGGTGDAVMGNTYDRLVRFGDQDRSRPVPDLAKSWSVSRDGRTFSFELKPGIRFASGNPLTAEDVVWSLQRAVILDKSPAYILGQFGFTRDNVALMIRQTGPLTLAISTDKDYAPSLLLNCLTANVASVVDKKLLLTREDRGDFGSAWLRTNYAGSGPLKLREWRPGELILLERNDAYHGPRAGLAKVIYRHVNESATQRMLLEKGDIDVALGLGPQDLDAVAREPALKTTTTPLGEVLYIAMNQKNPVLAKPEVREAMKWLVDYTAIEATVMNHLGVIQQNFLPDGLLGSLSSNPYRLDVARAKALLAKAGYPDGFKVTMDVRSNGFSQGLAEAFQQTARQAGVEIEILPGNGQQVMSRYFARKHDLAIMRWTADYWDPHSNAGTFASNPDNSDTARSRTLAWRNAWDIPELTRKSAAAVLERDGARRAALYRDIQDEFRRNSPFIMLFQTIGVAALRADVDGFKLGPSADSTCLFKVTKR